MIYIDLYWFILIYIDLYWFILIYIDLYWFILIYILIYNDLYWFILIYIDLYWFILIYILIYNDLYWFILIYIDLYWFYIDFILILYWFMNSEGYIIFWTIPKGDGHQVTVHAQNGSWRGKCPGSSSKISKDNWDFHQQKYQKWKWCKLSTLWLGTSWQKTWWYHWDIIGISLGYSMI